MTQEYPVSFARSIRTIKDEIKRRHGNDSSRLFASGQRDKFQWSIWARKGQRNTVQYILPAMKFKQEWKQRGERGLGGNRDHERVIWTCPRFGRAINSGRKLHPKGPNRSKYKTMTRIAYYALRMQIQKEEYKVLTATFNIWRRHFTLIYIRITIKEKKNEIYILSF